MMDVRVIIGLLLDISTQIFMAYIVTLALVKGNIFHKSRELFKGWTPWLKMAGIHGIDCRLCTGLYVSLGVWCFYGTSVSLFLIWGASYFLATQERA